MTIGFVASAIFGIAVGLRFRIYSLVLLTLLTVVAGALAHVVGGVDSMTVLATTATAWVGLQIGYVCGSFGASIKEQPAAAFGAPAVGSPRRYGVTGK